MYNNLGEVAQCKAEYDRAEGYFHEALNLSHDLGDKVSIIGVTKQPGQPGEMRANYARAMATYRKSLSLAREIGHKSGIVEALEGIAVAQTRDYRERALEVCSGRRRRCARR